jgi:hypothetical protein
MDETPMPAFVPVTVINVLIQPTDLPIDIPWPLAGAFSSTPVEIETCSPWCSRSGKGALARVPLLTIHLSLVAFVRAMEIVIKTRSAK